MRRPRFGGFIGAPRSAGRAQREPHARHNSPSAAVRVCSGGLSQTASRLSRPCIARVPEVRVEARAAVTSARPTPIRKACRCRHLRHTVRPATLEIFCNRTLQCNDPNKISLHNAIMTECTSETREKTISTSEYVNSCRICISWFNQFRYYFASKRTVLRNRQMASDPSLAV